MDALRRMSASSNNGDDLIVNQYLVRDKIGEGALGSKQINETNK